MVQGSDVQCGMVMHLQKRLAKGSDVERDDLLKEEE